jgi:hypothetical protein
MPLAKSTKDLFLVSFVALARVIWIYKFESSEYSHQTAPSHDASSQDQVYIPSSEGGSELSSATELRSEQAANEPLSSVPETRSKTCSNVRDSPEVPPSTRDPSSDFCRPSDGGSHPSYAIELGSDQAQPLISESDAHPKTGDVPMNASGCSPSPHDPRSEFCGPSNGGSDSCSAIDLGSERAVTQSLPSESRLLLKTCDDVLKAPESPLPPRGTGSALCRPCEGGSHLSGPPVFGIEQAVLYPLPGVVSKACDDVLQSPYPTAIQTSSVDNGNKMSIDKIISAVTGYVGFST